MTRDFGSSNRLADNADHSQNIGDNIADQGDIPGDVFENQEIDASGQVDQGPAVEHAIEDQAVQPLQEQVVEPQRKSALEDSDLKLDELPMDNSKPTPGGSEHASD